MDAYTKLPPPPAPLVRELRAQAVTGVSTVVLLIICLVTVVHLNAMAGAESTMNANEAESTMQNAQNVLVTLVDALAIFALVMLLAIMRGPRDLVVRRCRANAEPIPAVVVERLEAGETFNGLANPVDGEASYCVRCGVWRRPEPPVPTRLCLCVHVSPGRASRVHHCRFCGECVTQFDHHCGFFGRCIAGSIWHGGGNMRAFALIIVSGWGGGAVTAISVGLRLITDESGLLFRWRLPIIGLFLLWAIPAACVITCQICLHAAQLVGMLWMRNQQRGREHAREDMVPLTTTIGPSFSGDSKSPPADLEQASSA